MLSARSISFYVAATALAALTACTSSPAPAPPTVGAIATAAASPVATAAAAASPAAATAVAAASPAAATAVAAASPAAATAAVAASPAVATACAAASPAAATVVAGASPAAATAVAASPIRITGVQLGPSDVTVTVQNAGSAVVDLNGWRLRVGTATATIPAGARVAPGQSTTIHTAAGTNSASDVYLGQEAASLVPELRPGATVALVDAQGNVVGELRIPG